MKPYFKIFVMFVLAAFATSCLDMEPIEKLGETNFWKNTSDYKLFANQYYSWLRSFNSVTSDGPHSDYRSDLISGNTRNTYSNGTNTVPTKDDNFTKAYSRIREINTLLENAETYPHQKDISQYVGESLFFRAYVYFDLLQLYGNTLIVSTPLDINSPELSMPRNNRSDVADFIISDLNEAIKKLPDAKTLGGSARISREAAQAFLSRVALYEGTWQEFRENNETRAKELLVIARDAANSVISTNSFKIFKPEALGTQAYKYMFTLENTKSNPAGLTKNDNKEYILVKQYDTDVSGATLSSDPAGSFLGKSSFCTRKFANMFLGSDGLPIDTQDEQRYAETASEYENRDNRMENIMIIPGRPYWTLSKGRQSWAEDETDLAIAFTKSFNPNMNSGYFTQKWNAERQIAGYPGFDFPVIRYAEVLLNYTEAVYELAAIGGNAASYDVDNALNIGLNQTRQRVNPEMPALTVNFAKTHNLDLRAEIRRERTIELFHEGFRIDDLKRWNKAAEEMPMNLLGVKYDGTEFETTWTGQTRSTDLDGCIIMESGRVWEEKHYLLPLPIDQLQLHPQLEQNPGWASITSNVN